ncbi:MAG: hypothetical protein N2691_03725 [Patescibacteria group bacterium]|nr:hypothetical protein [Patescibacteria group bacterium]
MNKESLNEFGDKIKKQTGLGPEDEANASAAQDAAKETFVSATSFVAESLTGLAGWGTIEQDRGTRGVTLLVPPYSEDRLQKWEQFLKNAGLKFQSYLSTNDYKPHLLSALELASQIGITEDKLSEALSNLSSQIEERSFASSGTSYEQGSYYIEEWIVRIIAERKKLKAPESFRPTEERRNLMKALADSLDTTERQLLAKYAAGTSSLFSSSPFYPTLDVGYGPLSRQNIAVAITSQPFDTDQIARFMSQTGIQKDKFLLAMANPHLRKCMPLGAMMA